MLMFIISEVDNVTDQQFMVGLYTSHKKLMFKIAGRYIFEKQLVEDIVQESLVKLMRKVETLKQLERCKLEAYIVYTVKHTAFNHNRKMKQEKRYMVFDVDDKLVRGLKTSERFLEDAMTETEKIEYVRMVLGRLPDADQDIIIRKYYLKQSDREIAEAHGLKENSVRMRLTRIRRRFFDLLNEEGVIYEIT